MTLFFKRNARAFCIGIFILFPLSVLVGYYPRWFTGIFRKAAKPICPDCNIILISVDTLREDALGCFGYHRNTAPNLCAFAQNNNYFSQFYSQSSFTLDSHMSIMTGLYPSTHNVLFPLRDRLNPDIPTLAQVLQENGYRTIYAGITDDPNLPLDRGLERGFQEIYPIDSYGTGWTEGYKRILPHLIGNTPTFLFLHTYWVHNPYIPEEGPELYEAHAYPDIPLTWEAYWDSTPAFYQFVLSEYKTRLAASDTTESRERNHKIVTALSQAIQHNDPALAKAELDHLPSYERASLYDEWYIARINTDDAGEVSYLRSLYDERVRSLDLALKPLLDFVSRPDVKRKTIVMITSDHGEEFMEHGFLFHDNTIYNTSTHVPLIAAIPNLSVGKIDSLGQSIDIFPTILALTGISSRARLEGKSLLPEFLKNPEHQDYTFVISQHRPNVIQSIRDDTWKLYVYEEMAGYSAHTELYDMVHDASEQQNVAGLYPEEAARLARLLQSTLLASPRYEPVRTEFPSWIDAIKRKKLIENGYF